MRKSLNDNPLIALGVVAVLGIAVAFLLLSQMSKSAPSAPAAGTTPGATTSAPDTSSVAPAIVGAPTATGALPAPAATASAPGIGAFEPGPGLPQAVVDAYKRGDIVVLLVLKRNGIDDRAVAAAVRGIQRSSNVAVFRTYARRVARYSRIAEGVDLNRVPAMVVMRPRDLSHGVPTASVSYGFRNPETISQAFRDAAYRGPDNLPFSPR